MKVTIIGNNPHAADFIENHEIVNNYTDADVIICAGNVNWRSLYQKFNKLTSKQIILALDDNGELFRSKYGYSSINLKLKYLNESIDIIHKNIIYQGLFKGSKCFVPHKDNFKFYCGCEYNFFRVGNIEERLYDFVNSHSIPLVIEFYNPNLPNLIICQLDINKFPNSEVSKIINYRLCEFVLSR